MYPEAMKATFQVENPTMQPKVLFFKIASRHVLMILILSVSLSGQGHGLRVQENKL